jgi:hypothetical protein
VEVGDVFVEMDEKKQLPCFCFLGRGGIGVWRSEETGFCRKSTRTIDIGESRVANL